MLSDVKYCLLQKPERYQQQQKQIQCFGHERADLTCGLCTLKLCPFDDTRGRVIER